MRIISNIMADNTNYHLSKTDKKRAKSTEKLSSGLHLNRAADDAAGMAISEKMRAQIRGLNQASRNISDGTSLTNTAEGGMQEIHNILQRSRELLLQANSDTNSSDVDRPAIQAELDQLSAEIDALATTTEFNGIKLLDGHGEPIPCSYTPPPHTDRIDPAPSSPVSPPKPSPNDPVQRPITGNTIRVSGDGTLDLDAFGSISGCTIEVAEGSNILIKQSDPAKVQTNVTINCGAGANLSIENLNILNTNGASCVKFSSGDSCLGLIGENTLAQDISTLPDRATYNAALYASTQATVDVGSATVSIQDVDGNPSTDPVLNARITNDGGAQTERYAAIIGKSSDGTSSGTSGKLIIASGTVNATASGNINMYGSAIGGANYPVFTSGSYPDNPSGSIPSLMSQIDIQGYVRGKCRAIPHATNVTAQLDVRSLKGVAPLDQQFAAIGGVGGTPGSPGTMGTPGTPGSEGSPSSPPTGGINIFGGNVTATTNAAPGQNHAVAIGGTSGTIFISGGNTTVNATTTASLGTNYAAAIGNFGELRIADGTVNATAVSSYGAAIGGNGGKDGGIINLYGGHTTAEVLGAGDGAAVGGGGAVNGFPAGQGAMLSIFEGEEEKLLDILPEAPAQNQGHIGAGKEGGAISKTVDPGNVIVYDDSYKEACKAEYDRRGDIRNDTSNNINDIFDYILPNVFKDPGGPSVILDGYTGEPLYRTEIKLENSSFFPGQEIPYSLDGKKYIATVHTDGKLYLYQPVGKDGKELELLIGGGKYRGTLDLGDLDHEATSNNGVDEGYTDVKEDRVIWIQGGANANDGAWLHTYDCRAKALNVAKMWAEPHCKTEGSIDDVTRAINRVSSFCADAGAKRNRLEYAMKNVDNSSENLAAAESRIRDVDMAKEMSEYVKTGILTQAATAILAQANQAPQAVLRLLQ